MGGGSQLPRRTAPSRGRGTKKIRLAGPDVYPWDQEVNEQLNIRTIERIDVSHPDAGTKVLHCRENGIPVVISGHDGWCDFARVWLKNKGGRAGIQGTRGREARKRPEYEIDVNKIREDVGQELVPIISSTGGQKLSQHKRTFSWYIDNGWLPDCPDVYLFQFQFPTSTVASCVLDGQCKSLPEEILGEDLLQYWRVDKARNTGADALQGSPYRYISMGGRGSESELHYDAGGVTVTIAPVVGKKEVTLVHRRDGHTCLGNLKASLRGADPWKFPLAYFARVWKTTIIPGEILLIPQGSFYRDINLSRCLAYTRLYLDTVDLPPFEESMYNGDAGEIPHGLILRNSTTIISRRLEKAQREYTRAPGKPRVSDEIINSARTLIALKNACRSVGIRLETSIRVYGSSERSKKDANKREALIWRQSVVRAAKALHGWKSLTSRNKVPAFSSPPLPGSERFVTEEEEAFNKLPEPLSESDNDDGGLDDGPCKPGDAIRTRFCGKVIEGTVIAMKLELQCAFLNYSNFSKFWSEYQPYWKLRLPVTGEKEVAINTDDIAPGKIVVNYWGNEGQAYYAVVKSCHKETFLNTKLEIGRFELQRWIPQRDVIARVCQEE